jgi:hypothetical protein
VPYLESETPTLASSTHCDSATRHLVFYLTILGNHNRDIFLLKESICPSRPGTGHWSMFRSARLAWDLLLDTGFSSNLG